MTIRTTCIGAYPKPGFINAGSWSETEAKSEDQADARNFSYATSPLDSDTDDLLDRATREAVVDQVACGIDIPTDGEQRRENYIHYHCRHFEGLDFENLTTKVHRDGAAVADLPTISGKVVPDGDHFLDRDYRIAQESTDKPVKITIPGTITIMDTTADAWYLNDRQLAFDLADALNFEIRALADAGCKHIQVDEPLFARNVDMALDFGVECLERCFDGLPGDVQRIMHMCCGYPGHLDDDDYQKADPDSYRRLARSLADSCVDQISIEDAHRHNDLALLEHFPNSTLIFGSIAIADRRVETVDEISDRLQEALKHIDAHRLIAAPDCGLMMLSRELAMKKLRNMAQAAGAI
jgi:5-methyltetrahydropteroyltriglutamate--homocysteine methyltransferase